MSRHILALWRGFDVLMSPVTLTPPPKIGYLDPVAVEPREFNRRQSLVFGYTPPYNMTDSPPSRCRSACRTTGFPSA